MDVSRGDPSLADNSSDNDAPNGKLFGVGYSSLLATQFCGAANDNVLKQCLTFMVATGGIWAGPLGTSGLGRGGQVVPALCLTLPFILLSGYGGQVCDKFSKRQVMLWVKLAEIPIATVAFVGFYTHNLWLTLGAMLLLAIQSSFFGPAKYGVIPEIVAEKHLSMANGVINMLTNVAVIVGSLAAGPLCDLFHPDLSANVDSVPVPWAPGAALVGIALLGLLSIQPFPRIKAANDELVFDWNPFTTYYKSVQVMAEGPLLTVVLAWSGFYMVGMMALMILPEYDNILDITYTQTSYLLGILGVAIASGSVATGWISGDQIRPWLIPFGAAGMCIAFLLLGLLTPTYQSVAVLVFVAGFFAGFYIVPLQALIQLLSPDDERGRIIGTSGAISFCFSSLGTLVFWIAFNPLNMPANQIFLICAALSIVGTVYGGIRLKQLMGQRGQS